MADEQEAETPDGLCKEYFGEDLEEIKEYFNSLDLMKQFCGYFKEDSKRVFDELGNKMASYGSYNITDVYDWGDVVVIVTDAGGIVDTHSYDKPRNNHLTF